MKLDFFTKGNKTEKDKKRISFLFIMFLTGLLLLLFSKNLIKPSNNTKVDNSIIAPNTYKASDPQTYEEKLEKRLEKEFANIDGVGKVEVIIMLKTSGEIIINKDTPNSQTQSDEVDSEGGTRQNIQTDSREATVLINNSDGSTKPIILKELEPEISGVVIIAEGGDDILVKKNLINAAKVLLDVPMHKIEVMKMVQNKGE
ncbi:stage III sporulation protein AG [Vallitalea guaymasensis]|uniref:Stage III sporulation protein AG n=1 Tax=Vallitalea guaymasensis TaxID=1185412 RepID=A0A8J8MDI2_9FIRM|nr:stage III sporulation protein AG [Vallitalea guaymasensis]QUH31049.1 stage III sporulation protein AG [Vallitalea guaymasensis]